MRGTVVLALSFWASTAWASVTGGEVEEAIAVHISRSGLDQIGVAVKKLVPASLPFDDVVGDFECGENQSL